MSTSGLLVVKGSGGGGLGDAIRSVLVGALYAQATNRSIYIDWTHGIFGQKGVNMFPGLFLLKNITSVTELPHQGSVYPHAWEARLHKSLDDIYQEDGSPPWNRIQAIERYSFDMARINYPADVLVMWEFDQLPKLRPNLPLEWQERTDIELLGLAFNKYLEAGVDVSKEIDDLWKYFNGNKVIGLHVRMTDEFVYNKGRVAMRDYYKALEKALAASPGAEIFLATDNIACLQEIRSRYPSVVTREKWFAHAGESLHLNSTCPDDFKKTRDALVEMLALARCDHIICPVNSSFSMVSRMIANAHGVKQTLIYPARGLPYRLWNRLRRNFK